MQSDKGFVIQLGLEFWKIVSAEHGIDSTGVYVGDKDEQLERSNVFFSESAGGK